MNRFTHIGLVGILAAGFLSFVGCDSGETASIDPAVLSAYQSKLVLKDQPSDPVGIQELLIKMVGDNPNPASASADAVEVALLGQLGSGESEGGVFQADQAIFTMIDPTYQAPAEEGADEHAGHDHDGAEHDGHNDKEADEHTAVASTGAHEADCPCPFCSSSKQAIPQAIVSFVDENGDDIPVSAQELFKLSGDELVIVKGTAKLSVGQLLVTADKIYVRK